MKKTLSLLPLILAFSLSSLSGASAKKIGCTGINLIEKLKIENPASAKLIADEAAKLPYGEGLLWKISKPGLVPSYLFGTMHTADPRVVKLSDKTRRAFDGSLTLALEITEILDPQAMAQKAIGLMKFTTYLDGSSLDTKMTPEQIALLTPRLETKAGLPWGVAKKMRPWVLMGMLALPACETARKKAGKPFLDLSLGQKAQKAGKNIEALETIESQLNIMASLPEPLMVEALVETVKMGSKMDDVFETMIQLYAQEKIGTIWAMMSRLSPTGLNPSVKATGYAEFQRVVVDDRNITMVDESVKLIEKGSAFIAVGALHLPGQKGILSILVQKGYEVTRQ